jgi:hypothetical protein
LTLTEMQDNIWQQFVDGTNEGSGGSAKRDGQNETGDLSINDGCAVQVACSFSTRVTLPWAKRFKASHKYFHRKKTS